MPPEIRRVYERALETRNQEHVEARVKLVFNGQEYASLDEMPADVRKLYQHQQVAMETYRDFSVDATTPRAAKTPSPGAATRGASGPSRFNWLLIGGALVALALIVFILTKL
jgi:hypothetical protein